MTQGTAFRFSVRANRAHLVQWREWGPEAFQEAQDKAKLPVVFLTAFWCGFCQRMDESALSDDEVIALLNAFFVPIRVEESQRPDVDLRYNQDGWPTIAFHTPTGRHLFSVNYMETEPFVNLLVKLVDQYQQDQQAFLESAGQTSPEKAHEEPVSDESEQPLPLGPGLVAEITGMVEGLEDHVNGGFGGKFKFLHTEAIEFLLYLFESAGHQPHLDHVKLTLDKMRRSKMYDLKDGGFFRYSSQADWGEPHPEKLLDDQAALLHCYVHAYLLTDDSSYRETAEALINYLDTALSPMAPGSGFFGCQDYFRPEGPLSAAGDSEPAPMLSVIDQYIYCDANAQTASAYLEAWWVLGIDKCRTRAQEVLEFLWASLRGADGGMCHYWDGEARAPGLLTDAVATGSAFLDAYRVLHDPKYLAQAKELAEDILRLHRNPAGGFHDIRHDKSQTEPASLRFPLTVLTQNAAVAAFFVGLADLTGAPGYREHAVWALKSFPNTHREHGAFAAGFGHALSRLLTLPLTVTLPGATGHPSIRARAALTQRRQRDLVLRFREDLPAA